MSLLGETLRNRREELGIDQSQLARDLGVSQQSVSRWESGMAMPRAPRVVALAQRLSLDVVQLQRFAGHLPPGETSDLGPQWRAVYDRMPHLTRAELILLIDRAWEELRRRENLHPPGLS